MKKDEKGQRKEKEKNKGKRRGKEEKRGEEKRREEKGKKMRGYATKATKATKALSNVVLVDGVRTPFQVFPSLRPSLSLLFPCFFLAFVAIFRVLKGSFFH